MRTKLMSKLFSQECSEEYREKILNKIDEAHKNGSATLEEGDEILQFAEVEGNIIIEDQTTEPYEVTEVSENPKDENDLILTAVEIPQEEVHTESNVEDDSKLVQSIEIKRIPGPDGKSDDIVDDLEIEVETGIEDEEKSGTYSIRFKNTSERYARIFAKVFSAMESELDAIVDSADVDEDVEVEFNSEDEMRVMSIKVKGPKSRRFSESEESEESEEKSQYEEGFEAGEEYQKGKEAEEADETKLESDELPEDPESEESKEETEESEESDDLDITEVLNAVNELAELASEGITPENAEEIKEKAEEILDQAEELEEKGAVMSAVKVMCKNYSEECARCLDEKETCEEHEMDKDFSDPKVTLTIDDLTPASVATLLQPAGSVSGQEEKEEPVESTEPLVDPNSEDSRKFSVTKKKGSINPYLTTEIK